MVCCSSPMSQQELKGLALYSKRALYLSVWCKLNSCSVEHVLLGACDYTLRLQTVHSSLCPFALFSLQELYPWSEDHVHSQPALHEGQCFFFFSRNVLWWVTAERCARGIFWGACTVWWMFPEGSARCREGAGFKGVVRITLRVLVTLHE